MRAHEGPIAERAAEAVLARVRDRAETLDDRCTMALVGRFPWLSAEILALAPEARAERGAAWGLETRPLTDPRITIDRNGDTP